MSFGMRRSSSFVESTPAQEQALQRPALATNAKPEPPQKSQTAAPPQKSLGFWPEVANALTMVPLPVVTTLTGSRSTLLFSICSWVHMTVSVTFHVLLAAAQIPRFAHRVKPAWVRMAMDVDMSLSHAVGLSGGIIVARATGAMTLSFSVCLVLNVAALLVIWTSRAYGADLDRELLTRRFPLLGGSIFLEAYFAWARGATVAGPAMAGIFTLICICTLLDERLRGWGHPVGHALLWPGGYFRVLALKVA